MLAAFTNTYGPADVLEVREAPMPSLGPRDVLVRVQASPVTAGDLRLRAANFPGAAALAGRLMFGLRRPRHPIQGSMFAGIVMGLGSEVRDYALGDRVFGYSGRGAYAECVVMAEDGAMARMPAGLGFDEGAALVYGLSTSLHFLDALAELGPGQSVLILGGAGGVGRYATQLAKHRGAEVTVSASAAKHGLARELGADHVIDYRSQDFRTLGHRYDLIFDLADVSSFRASKASLRAGGRYVSVFVKLENLWAQAFNRFRTKQAACDVAIPDHAMIEAIAGLVEAGAVRPVIAERFELREIAAAHDSAERGPGGDVIVEMAA